MELTSSVKSYKGKLAVAISERYAPQLQKGEALPDYVLMLELAVRDAQSALDRLVALDDEVDDVAIELGLQRSERDRLVSEELFPRAVTVRQAIELAFGKERGSTFHGLKGRTRRKPAGLLRQVMRMLRRLTDPERELPAPKHRFVAIDRDRWRRQLQGPYQRLSQLEKSITRGGAELSSLVYFRKRAMEAFDVAYGDALRQVIVAFQLARFDSRMIKNLKPYYQRRRLSRKARKQRDARAARAAEQAAEASSETSGDEAEEASTRFRPLAGEARATLSKSVAKWLQKRQVSGS